MRQHWRNCITNFDDEVQEFVDTYFAEEHRQCLLIAAAGFDPRSQRIARLLASALGSRLCALFVREERGQPDANLRSDADANEASLRAIVPRSTVARVDVFGDDGAAVGGPRIAALLGEYEIPDGITDIVLDLSALSIGVGFPTAKMLLAGPVLPSPDRIESRVGRPHRERAFRQGDAGKGLRRNRPSHRHPGSG
jgi:hypothetical protein